MKQIEVETMMAEEGLLVNALNGVNPKDFDTLKSTVGYTLDAAILNGMNIVTLINAHIIDYKSYDSLVEWLEWERNCEVFKNYINSDNFMLVINILEENFS